MATNINSITANIETTLNDEIKLLQNTLDERELKIVQYLMKSGVDDNEKCKNLRNKAREGNKHYVKALIATGADIGTKDFFGSPLHISAEKGHVDIVKILIHAGADINDKDGRGRTPLHFSSLYGHVDVVKYLVAVGADVNAKDTYGSIALHCGAKNGSLDIVDILLAADADVDAKDSEGWTPLHCSAKKGHSQVVKTLIAAGADTNVKIKYDGSTPLILSAYGGHLDTVKVLIRAGVNINAKSEDGTTPLFVSAKEGYLDIVNALLSAGADANEKGGLSLSTALHESAYKNYVEIVKALIAGGADTDAKDGNEMTPLRVADLSNCVEARKVLIKHTILMNFESSEIKNYLDVAKLSAHSCSVITVCEEEVIEMRETKLGRSSISLFSFLRETNENKVALYTSEDNFGIRNELQRAQYKDKFPAYAENIEDQFRKGSERARLLDQSTNLMKVCFFKELPIEVCRKISEYLTNGDLMSFVFF